MTLARDSSLGGLVLLVLAMPGAHAEDRKISRTPDAAAQLLSVVGLVATPDITASRLETEDTGQLNGQRIDTLRLANDISIPFQDGALYFEGNLGFARAAVDLRLGDGVRENVNFDALGAFGAVGPDLAITRHFRARPLIILGTGYADDDFGLPGPIDEEDDTPELDIRQWSGAVGFGLSLDYERPLGDDEIDLRFKASQVYFETLWSKDDRFTGDTSNQNINASAVYKYDTGLRLAETRVLLTGLLGANAFLGDQRDALGFAWFAEYGGGVELDLRRLEGAVQRARVRVTGIAGDGVTGISVGAGIGF